LFGAGALTFHEFMTREAIPLAVIQQAVLEFLQGRETSQCCCSPFLN